jgi:hypothetical protein
VLTDSPATGRGFYLGAPIIAAGVDLVAAEGVVPGLLMTATGAGYQFEYVNAGVGAAG